MQHEAAMFSIFSFEFAFECCVSLRGASIYSKKLFPDYPERICLIFCDHVLLFENKSQIETYYLKLFGLKV